MKAERGISSTLRALLPLALLALAGLYLFSGGAGWPLSEPVEPGPPLQGPALIEFHMPGCAACTRMETAVQRLRQDCAGRDLDLRQIDVTREENRALVRRLGVEVVPTVVGLDAAGKERVRFVGERSLDQLRAAAAALTGGHCAGVTGRHALNAPRDDAGAGCPHPTARAPEAPQTLCGG